MHLVVKGLQSFTGGMPQHLLDHYRKWQVRDPVELLKGLWKELKRHFASVTVISNSLLERLWNRPILASKNMIICYSSQIFARILSQATYLPGLGYLEAIAVYRRQMEGKIVDYSNSNGRVYPPFSRFCTTAQEHAKINNNPAAD